MDKIEDPDLELSPNPMWCNLKCCFAHHKVVKDFIKRFKMIDKSTPPNLSDDATISKRVIWESKESHASAIRSERSDSLEKAVVIWFSWYLYLYAAYALENENERERETQFSLSASSFTRAMNQTQPLGGDICTTVELRLSAKVLNPDPQDVINPPHLTS